jgi:hypothetical protein
MGLVGQLDGVGERGPGVEVFEEAMASSGEVPLGIVAGTPLPGYPQVAQWKYSLG